jgi:DNA-binding transcriptional LysR family regulator
MNALSEQTQTIENGWETRISVACDSILDIAPLFDVMRHFLEKHQNIEIDVQEEVMNGSWEALIQDNVDLVIGAPAPVPSQKGIRAIKMFELMPVLVVHKSHVLASTKEPIHKSELSQYRTVVVHDSARTEIARSVNVIEGSRHFYVATMNQKIAAITAGVGIGYLPKELIQHAIDSGELHIIELIDKQQPHDLFMAWKITNKGKGLRELRSLLESHLTTWL